MKNVKADQNFMLVTEFLECGFVVYFLVNNLILECEYYTCSTMNCIYFALVLLGNAFLSKCCIKCVCTEVNG